MSMSSTRSSRLLSLTDWPVANHRVDNVGARDIKDVSCEGILCYHSLFVLTPRVRGYR